MKTSHAYLFVALSFLTIALSSCGKRMNNRVTLWRNHKIPYGTYYAYNNLEYIFSKSSIEINDESPERFSDNKYSSAYIIISPFVRPSEDELKALLQHAMSGNHVFISALYIGENLLDTFRLKEGTSGAPLYGDSLSVKIFDPESRDSVLFAYPGMRLDSYFSEMDSSVTNVLGRNERGEANFVKFSYQNGGSVFIHYAPATFTNFFLLHKNNKRYYDLALSVIPDSVSIVMWDNYFRNHENGSDIGNRSGFSKLKLFLQDDALRWAFWLTILLFGIVFLIESKRKQRIVPELPRLKNTSLDFVKTIGRLYYQRKDNKNLAAKMITQFLGQIRARYNLQTASLSDEFVDKLAFKSGYATALVRDIVTDIKKMEDAQVVTDEELLAFNDKLDSFITNKPSYGRKHI